MALGHRYQRQVNTDQLSAMWFRADSALVLTTVEVPASRDGVGSSQRRNTDGLCEASKAANESAGQRS
jgi:hypothetical protein